MQLLWLLHSLSQKNNSLHYCDVIMSAMASQITSLTVVYPTVYSDADQRKHQSAASLAFARGIHWWPLNSPHKWPVTRKMLPFDDVIMLIGDWIILEASASYICMLCIKDIMLENKSFGCFGYNVLVIVMVNNYYQIKKHSWFALFMLLVSSIYHLNCRGHIGWHLCHQLN